MEEPIQVGGLSNSFGYAFENEAYRMLPRVLSEKYGIEIVEKFIRTELGGKEIKVKKILKLAEEKGVRVV